MNKTLYIHIGGHKTGTSAIQEFLFLNRKRLMNKGYLYPLTGGKKHHFIPLGLQNRPFHTNPKELTRSFVKEIQESKQENIVISSEVFEMLHYEEISRLKELITDEFLVKIIFYMRRQDLNIESRYNQLIRASARLEKKFDEYFNDNSFQVLDYYALLLPWRQAFGKENVIVRVYEKEQLPNGLFDDFLNAIGLDLDKTYKIPTESINPSLNWDLVEIIRLCNIHFKEDPNFHRYLLNALSRIHLKNTIPNGKQDLLSPQQRHDIAERFSESNEKVAREYLGRKDGRLFYAPLPDLDEPWEPYNGLTVEIFVPIFAQMLYNIHKKNQKKIKNVRMPIYDKYSMIRNRILSVLKRYI